MNITKQLDLPSQHIHNAFRRRKMLLLTSYSIETGPVGSTEKDFCESHSSLSISIRRGRKLHMAFSIAQANMLLKLPLQNHMSILVDKIKIMRLKINFGLHKNNKNRFAGGWHCIWISVNTGSCNSICQACRDWLSSCISQIPCTGEHSSVGTMFSSYWKQWYLKKEALAGSTVLYICI